MARIHRLLSCIALASSMTVSSLWAQETPKPGDAAPADIAATQPTVAIPQNKKLRDDAEDFWHYGKMARYDLAAAYADKLLSRPEPPLEILQAIEAADLALRTTTETMGGVDDWMVRWQGVPDPKMRESVTRLDQVVRKGRFERRQNPKFIEANIEHLGNGPKGYILGLEGLKDSGEIAVPIMVDWLRDPAKVQLHGVIERALAAMELKSISPLLAATEMKDNNALTAIISVLRNLRYEPSMAYLARLAQDSSRPAETRAAAAAALKEMGANSGAPVADQFYRLADKFYSNSSPIQIDPKASFAYIWNWTDQGLNYKQVPPSIFSDLMAMREARHALELGAGRGDALSLWLAANMKMEVDLPEGASSGVFPKDRLPANYFNVYAGAQYLNAVLTRCLADHNSAVALKTIKSLAEIVGPSSQGSGSNIDPLVAAMHYSDRLVRFEAAFALASGLPNRNFKDHELVATLLAEAVAQTGTGNLLIVAPSQNDITKLSADLKQFGTAGGTNATQALGESASLPWVDAIVIYEDIGTEQIDAIYKGAADDTRLERAAKVIIAHSRASQWFERAARDPLTTATTATDTAGIQQAITDARAKVGGVVLDEKVATGYATHAAEMLQRLAEGRVQVYDLTPVQPQLLAALGDKRPEIVKLIANTVAYINGPAVQPGLLTRAMDEKATDDVKVALYKGLAKNAKFFGKQLGEQQVNDLQKAVESAQNIDVRTAAAEARGALNLSADQAKALIIQESKP